VIDRGGEAGGGDSAGLSLRLACVPEYGGRMKVTRLDHFGIDVTDLSRAERFYIGVLGMTVEMRLADQVLLSYGAGRCALFLKPERVRVGLEQLANPLGKSHHCFEVTARELDEAPAYFADRRIPFHPPIDWGDHDCLYFLDPDGNLLELVAYRKTALTAG
jgi:catechol 2,3-dioxygenase-like lactoylglutathione lyase family enzyme